MGFDVVEEKEQRAKIRIIGVGGGGGNAINNMIAQGMEGVEFIVVNTDAQDLDRSFAPTKFQIGNELTKGLGAGGVPNTGREAALEDKERLVELVSGCDMVFVAAGMGGGTGTGAAPVVAQIAKECGALTVAIVTRPFHFEGARRRRNAEEGIENLRNCVDTLITIPNQRLISMATETTSLKESFEQADRVLHQAVKGVSDLINLPGEISVDFADVCTIMKDKGVGLMGIGQAAGEDRVMQAAYAAINSPLLDEVSLAGAKSVLVNVTSSSNLGIIEVAEATQMIQEEAHEDANVIFGWIVDEDMEGDVRVTVVATEFDENWTGGASKVVPRPPSQQPQPTRKTAPKSKEIPTIQGKSKPLGPRPKNENPNRRGRSGLPGFFEGN
jgi:cell division protein FtsZ